MPASVVSQIASISCSHLALLLASYIAPRLYDLGLIAIIYCPQAPQLGPKLGKFDKIAFDVGKAHFELA